ncbi:MAG: RNA polymerase sigma factor [Clostridiales bacterium]|nr:RNA polymerase sigma factor [Clostridiales bacterium]
MDELRLIKKIQRNGDRAAADKLVRYYYDEIYGFVRKQVPNLDIALELTQEIFISMLKTIGLYNIKKGAGFRTWLYKIATNKIIDWFRSRNYSKMIKTISLDEVEPVDESDFIRKLENRDFAKKICGFLSGVPTDTQKIFRLHIFGGYTFSEIAGMEELPEGSVKSRYYRLINLIRKEFANYE